MTNQYDGIAITKQLLFGTSNVPADFNERVRPVDTPTPVFNVDSDAYLATGAGRYGWPSRANLVEKFFANSGNLTPGVYSVSELFDALELIGVAVDRAIDLRIPINNYALDALSNDWAERAYLFGGASADLQSASFQAGPYEPTISNIVIQPRGDNFDFTSGSTAAQVVNNVVLKPALPS